MFWVVYDDDFIWLIPNHNVNFKEKVMPFVKNTLYLIHYSVINADPFFMVRGILR